MNAQIFLISSCPNAIALATGRSVEEIKRHLSTKFALAVDDDGYIEAFPPQLVIECDGKHIFNTKTNGLEYAYNCTKYDVAKKMKAEQVCEDIKTFLIRVNTLFSS